jgi:hypothetical protein
VESLDNKTHGLLDDCLSLERVRRRMNISFTPRRKLEITTFCIQKPIRESKTN